VLGDSLGNTSDAERGREKERGSKDEVRSEIMEEPGRPPTLARSHRRTKTNYAAELAVRFFGFSRESYRCRCATTAELSGYGPMIDVKLCKNCRPALKRERNMRFFHARGTFLFMANTDKELKATADKPADIILEIDRSTEKQKTIPLTIDGDSSKKIKHVRISLI